jgi:hypothetical protein
MKKILIDFTTVLKKKDRFTDHAGVEHKIKEVTYAPSNGTVYIETTEGKMINLTKALINKDILCLLKK